MTGLPHIVYLSRGRLFDYSGGRDAQELKQFAYDKLNRHSAQQRAEGDEAEGDGRVVPAPLSAGHQLRDALLKWSGQLHHTLTAMPAVSTALLSLGALLGALVTILSFALLLPNQPPHTTPANSVSAKQPVNGGGAGGKARKAD